MGAVILLAVLCVPIVIWMIVHRKPREKAAPEAQSSGPKHRWWQP
jgi:hypothetical protein